MDLVTLFTLAIFAAQGQGHKPQPTNESTAPTPTLASLAPSHGGFNPNTVLDFQGKIVGIEVYTPPTSSVPFVDILVRLKNAGTALVELGPKGVVDADRLNLYMGDQIWVKGSKVVVKGDSTILAQEVRHQGTKNSFRRPDGTPFWK